MIIFSLFTGLRLNQKNKSFCIFTGTISYTDENCAKNNKPGVGMQEIVAVFKKDSLTFQSDTAPNA